MKSASDEQRKPRGACTPKGSPTSLIYPLKGKLTSFLIKQFFAFGRVHQTLSRSRLRRFCFVRYAHLRKTSTCAEMTVLHSRNDYDPRVLRMTKSAHCLRYMECHIPPTSKTAKPFLELRCILCRLSLRRTPNPIPCCHPEQARIVSPVATHYNHLRARRSFAF